MQFTVRSGVKSDPLRVKTRIPQGSVLGPTLFSGFFLFWGLCICMLMILQYPISASLQT